MRTDTVTAPIQDRSHAAPAQAGGQAALSADEQPTNTSKNLGRLNGWHPRPIRLLHRGFRTDAPFSAQGAFNAAANFGRDGFGQVVTGLARPFTAPVMCAHRAAAHRRRNGLATALTAGALGGVWGLDEGLTGGAVSVGAGAGMLAELVCLFSPASAFPQPRPKGWLGAGSAVESKLTGETTSRIKPPMKRTLNIQRPTFRSHPMHLARLSLITPPQSICSSSAEAPGDDVYDDAPSNVNARSRPAQPSMAAALRCGLHAGLGGYTALGSTPPQLCGAEKVDDKQIAQAVHQMTSSPSGNSVHALALILSQFKTPAVQQALDAVPTQSPEGKVLLRRLQMAFFELWGTRQAKMFGGDVSEGVEVVAAQLAVWLINHCTWQQLGDRAMLNTLENMFDRPDVLAAYLEAEHRDAEAARDAASTTFPGVQDPQAYVEEIIRGRRQVDLLRGREVGLILAAARTGDFAPVERLMAFAPGLVERHMQDFFEAVTPANAEILPHLREFCDTHGIEVPQALQTPPEPLTLAYLQTVAPKLLEGGSYATNASFFWNLLMRATPQLREQLLKSELDSAQDSVIMLLQQMPLGYVHEAFPHELLWRTIADHPDMLEDPLLAFGDAFGEKLLDTLPTEKLNALIAANQFSAVLVLTMTGQWKLLGKLMAAASDDNKKQILDMVKNHGAQSYSPSESPTSSTADEGHF